jgi:hypothetical protein
MEALMKRLRFGVALVYLVLTTVSAVHTQDKPTASASDVLTIDGAKNPEMVPNWAAWLEAFRFMAAPAAPIEPIPTTIYLATSKEQRALIRKESLLVMAQEREFGQRALKLQDGLTAENMSDRSDQADALEMKRRRAALDARDRLLAALPLEGQIALREFAEHVRKGYKATVVKSKLAQFLAPE